MAEVPPVPAARVVPLVVRTHVTPWGFLVALPMAFAFCYIGALILDEGAPLGQAERYADYAWLAGLPLIGFGLFLFLIGIGELARYMKPAVELVMDGEGLTTYGVLGARRLYWEDIVELRIEDRHVAIRARHGGVAKTVRLHFDRLDVEPALVLDRIRRQRTDLEPVRISG